MNARRLGLTIVLILIGVLCRIVPHPMNFAPVGAIALFAGAALTGRSTLFAMAVPVAAMLAGDVVLEITRGNQLHPILIVVYATYALIALGGRLLRGRQDSIPAVGAGATAGAVFFYLVTNFAMWTTGMTYPLTWDGLAACYIAGLPFLGRTLASDLMFSALFFGAFVWFERHVSGFAPEESAA